MNKLHIVVLMSLLILSIWCVVFISQALASTHESDTYRPLIEIIDPVSGSSLHDSLIMVNGTSYDNQSGIRKVEVMSQTYPLNDRYEFKLATPVAYNNWSEWSIPISIETPGIYRIMAHAVDKAGNENWHESIMSVPFFAASNSSTLNPQNHSMHVAFVNPTFTDAAYSPDAFYDFYAKYQGVAWGKNISKDLDMLKTNIKDPIYIPSDTSSEIAKNMTKFSSLDPDNNHIITLSHTLERNIPNTLFTVIRDEDVHNGYIFSHDGNNAYDILILSHDEYVTTSMYQNYKRFVDSGGIIIFLDGNIFYAEVDYDKKNHTLTLVKGHFWEFDDVARKSVGERWFYENQEWVGSNFLESHIDEDISFKNNPFNYSHFEENYVSNPRNRILIDYGVELPESMSQRENATVATYELDVGKGKVIMMGIYAQKLINNSDFLNFFQKLLLGAINVNETNFSTVQHIENNDTKDDHDKTIDKFGITKLYPTKNGGREWYIDMSDPVSDKTFYTTAKIIKQADGSWQVDGQQVKNDIRLEVGTPNGTEKWKNVEITGYAKVIRTIGHESYVDSDLDNVFQWYARGGKHDDARPCEGSSIKGRLYLNGDTSWIKEIWHDGGYTKEKNKSPTTGPLVWKNYSDGSYYDGKWFGFKVIIINIEDSAVSMESYIDSNADNNWTKVNNLVDNGNWSSDSPEFYNVDCNRPSNYVVTGSGAIAAFRTDNMIWDFKYLSVREISRNR